MQTKKCVGFTATTTTAATAAFHVFCTIIQFLLLCYLMLISHKARQNSAAGHIASYFYSPAFNSTNNKVLSHFTADV